MLAVAQGIAAISRAWIIVVTAREELAEADSGLALVARCAAIAVIAALAIQVLALARAVVALTFYARIAGTTSAREIVVPDWVGAAVGSTDIQSAWVAIVGTGGRIGRLLTASNSARVICAGVEVVAFLLALPDTLSTDTGVEIGTCIAVVTELRTRFEFASTCSQIARVNGAGIAVVAG